MMCGQRARLSMVLIMGMAKIFYVIGASGSGKDSLIDYVRNNVSSDVTLGFPIRYITRPVDMKCETHIEVTRDEFQPKMEQGKFAMNWHSHNTFYGIGQEINEMLERGISVVINGSREYLNKACKIYKNLVPILITVDKETLYRRLKTRGRESDEQIEKRIQRTSKVDKWISSREIHLIPNDGTIKQAGTQLLEFIKQQIKIV